MAGLMFAPGRSAWTSTVTAEAKAEMDHAADSETARSGFSIVIWGDYFIVLVGRLKWRVLKLWPDIISRELFGNCLMAGTG
jgi:hypothetical protein